MQNSSVVLKRDFSIDFLYLDYFEIKVIFFVFQRSVFTFTGFVHHLWLLLLGDES